MTHSIQKFRSLSLPISAILTQAESIEELEKLLGWACTYFDFPTAESPSRMSFKSHRSILAAF